MDDRRLPQFGPRLTRRSALAGVSAYGITRIAGASQTAGSLVGVPASGLNGWEFIGRVNQDGFNLGFTGYVTYVAGLDTSLLFTDVDPTERTEANARITISGSAMAVSRSIVDRVFAVNAEGTVQFHLAPEVGALFGTPETFAMGDTICSMAIRIHSTISVYAPQQGIASASGEATIDTTSPFDLGGGPVMIGNVGQTYRYSHNGVGELLDPERLVSVIAISGHGAIAG
jgi:hypothetical protein